MTRIKLFNGYPKAYRRDVQTKLLWLYKTSVITRSQWMKARFANAVVNAINAG